MFIFICISDDLIALVKLDDPDKVINVYVIEDNPLTLNCF